MTYAVRVVEDCPRQITAGVESGGSSPLRFAAGSILVSVVVLGLKYLAYDAICNLRSAIGLGSLCEAIILTA